MAQLLTMGAATLQTSVTVTTTNETLVLVSPPVSNPTAGGAMVIIAAINLLVGSGTNMIANVGIRRGGTLTGPLLGSFWSVPVGSGVTYSLPIIQVDYPGDRDHMLYAVTVQVAGATGNSTVNSAGILVLTI